MTDHNNYYIFYRTLLKIGYNFRKTDMKIIFLESLLKGWGEEISWGLQLY